LTDSLVPVAERLGTSYIAITTLLVSLIISLPEIFSATYSYLLGHLDIGLGVVIGSVMANVGLIVGISAMVKPLKIEKSIVIRDGLFLIVTTIIVLVFGSDLQYERSEGIVLLLLFIPYALNVWFFEKWRPRKSQNELLIRAKKNLSLFGKGGFKLKPSFLTFVFSGILLIAASYLFSFSLVEIAEAIKMPGIIIGLIFGAIGTSLPNIAAAVHGTMKGFKDAAITETFGSNIFTLLITLGIIIVLAPFSIGGRVFYFDLTWMIIINLLLIFFIFKGYHYREESVTRFEGATLVVFYIVLMVANVLLLYGY